MSRLNLIGRRFDRLTVVAQAETVNSRTRWVCRCDCGAETVVIGALLTSKQTRSCGCLKRELDKARKTRLVHGHARHGQPRSATYNSWIAMRVRCTDPTADSYADYGGRGITVCERWLNSFEAFLEDMGERPPGTSIDRLDGSRGYEPGNCRWATAVEQNRNTRAIALSTAAVDLVRYMHKRGSRRADLAHAFGVSESTIGNVVARRTWA